MKIAFLVNSLCIGGAEHVVRNLCRHFYNKGADVLLITSRRAETEYELTEPIRRIMLEELIDGRYDGAEGGLKGAISQGDSSMGEESRSMGKDSRSMGEESLLASARDQNRLFKGKLRILGRLLALKKIWAMERPDIILSFIGKLNIYTMVSIGPAIRLAKRRGHDYRPGVYLSVRSDPKMEYPGLQLRIADHLFKKSDGVIFQTKEAGDYFDSKIRKKSAILPNALDESFLEPPYAGERDGRMVMVGRLDENKNHKMVIEALAEAGKTGLKPTLEIYGDSLPGDDTALRLKELVNKKGMEKQVLFMGRRSGIRKLIERASVFILASGYEGMPNALLEAMAAGLACISTDCPCGGPAGVIRNGENGILIPVGDTRALKEAIIDLYNNKEKRESLGREAAKIQTELSPQRVNGLWEEFLTGKYKKIPDPEI